MEVLLPTRLDRLKVVVFSSGVHGEVKVVEVVEEAS